ncbi:MAG: hypothetical protein J6334_02700 [Kiritimatiellae bacterium]|nr:hypothetical protein [Kiritimatiellia bacterium]
MNLSNRERILFFGGLFTLGIFGSFLFRRRPRLQVVPPPRPPLKLPEAVRHPPDPELDGLRFSVDRKRRTVRAHDAATGALVWESSGEDRFIIPGAAFPIDLTPDGELWVANVGRKRLEQLDPKTGRFIASWRPTEPFGGCCNPVRFAALAGGRFVTMEKGSCLARIYAPSGDLEREIATELSPSEYDYYLHRERRVIHLYDTLLRSHWKVPYDLDT